MYFTTVILTSVVSGLDHERVKLFVALLRRLLKFIERLIFKTYLGFLSFINITFRLLHVYPFL